MTDGIQFEKWLDDHPKDWITRSIYADYLFDVGDVLFSEYQRYVVEKKLAPSLWKIDEFSSRLPWSWWLNGSSEDYDVIEFRFWEMLRNFTNRGSGYTSYDTRDAAERALCTVLHELGIIKG